MIGGTIAMKLLGGLGKLAKFSIPVPIAAIAVVAIWLHFDKRSDIRQAVDQVAERLVHSAEKEALAAQLAQEKRLREIGDVALAGYTRALAEIDARAAEAEEQREKEIAEYEQRLAEAGRQWLLDGGDVDWLLRP